MQTYWNISRKRMRRRWRKRWTETEGGKDGAKESGRKKKKQEYKAQYIIMPLAIAKAPQACLKFHLFCYDRCQNSDPWEWRALFCPKISIIRERAGQISLNSCLFQPWFDLLHSLQCQSRDFLKLSDKDPPLYRPWRPLGHVLTHWEMKEMTEKVVGRGGAPRWAVVCCIEPNNPPDAFCFKARDVIRCFRLHSGTPADSRQVAMRSEWPSPPQALLRLLRKSEAYHLLYGTSVWKSPKLPSLLPHLWNVPTLQRYSALCKRDSVYFTLLCDWLCLWPAESVYISALPRPIPEDRNWISIQIHLAFKKSNMSNCLQKLIFALEDILEIIYSKLLILQINFFFI